MHKAEHDLKAIMYPAYGTQRRFDVIMTLSLRHVPPRIVVCEASWHRSQWLGPREQFSDPL